jgi:hypothetical protein
MELPTNEATIEVLSQAMYAFIHPMVNIAITNTDHPEVRKNIEEKNSCTNLLTIT